jgi:hypothetical protein
LQSSFDRKNAETNDEDAQMKKQYLFSILAATLIATGMTVSPAQADDDARGPISSLVHGVLNTAQGVVGSTTVQVGSPVPYYYTNGGYYYNTYPTYGYWGGLGPTYGPLPVYGGVSPYYTTRPLMNTIRIGF